MKRSKEFKKMKRRVNAHIRALNRQLKEDVFGERFYCRSAQMKIHTYFDGSWTIFHNLEFIDRKTAEVRMMYNVSDWEFRHSWKIFETMNNLIIESDFWEDFRKNKNQG